MNGDKDSDSGGLLSPVSSATQFIGNVLGYNQGMIKNKSSPGASFVNSGYNMAGMYFSVSEGSADMLGKCSTQVPPLPLGPSL
jgi:hypothetical protein